MRRGTGRPSSCSKAKWPGRWGFAGVFLLLVLVLAPKVGSQESCGLNVRDRSGSAIGKIEANGAIRDRSGSAIGSFDRGTVRDRSGSAAGRVDSDGTIRSRSGSSIGRVEDNGTLRNRSGTAVGRIDADGTVRTGSGSSAGRFEGYGSGCRHVAAAYLFFFEPLHDR